MLVTKCYVVNLTAVDFNPNQFIKDFKTMVNCVECSADYHLYFEDDSWMVEIEVTCYEQDVRFVESMLAPFV